MPVKTKRWNDAPEPDDGYRVLITRFLPRGIRKTEETWNAWEPHLGPSPAVLKAFKGLAETSIPWPQYRKHYLAEMRGPEQQAKIAALAERVRHGEMVTLLCSSSCVRESRCHRSLLRELIEARVATAA